MMSAVVNPETVPEPLAQATPAALSPAEFERFVARLFSQTAERVEDLRVTLQDLVQGSDGSYAIDATVRYRLAGMDFLVLAEAKLHRHPIKRELVQVLHSKVNSVGAQKGVLVATAPFQSGAIEYGRIHGIALVHVADEVRWVTRQITRLDPYLELPRQPVARCWSRSETGRLTSSVVSNDPEQAAELLLGCPLS